MKSIMLRSPVESTNAIFKCNVDEDAQVAVWRSGSVSPPFAHCLNASEGSAHAGSGAEPSGKFCTGCSDHRRASEIGTRASAPKGAGHTLDRLVSERN
jgi:hypothetical protein